MSKGTIKKRIQNQEWALLALLLLLAILLRLPSLEQPFDNDSGAIAYHARHITRGEPLYGIHHPSHHMPAAYYTYALAFLLFGDSVWAVKFLLILWTIVVVCLLYRLGALMMDRSTGLLAAFLYIVLSSHVGLFGSSAEIELFANLPRTAAVLITMHLTTQSGTVWKFLFVGLLSAIAVLYKGVYLSPLALACFVLLVELWRNRAAANMWQVVVKRGLWVGAGFAVGLLSVVVYFSLLGLLPRFLLVFTLGQKYVNYQIAASPLSQYWPLLPFIGLARSNGVLLLFSLGGLLSSLGDLRKYRSRRDKAPTVFYVSVWYILSCLEASVTRIYYLHYYLLVIPPLALLAAWFLLKAYRTVKNQVYVGARLIAVSSLAMLLLVALFVSVRQNFDYYYLYTRYRLGLGTWQDFVSKGWPAFGPEMIRVQKLADYVREHTLPSDYVYYWSGDVQIYYLADRRCSIDTLFPPQIELTGPHQRIFVPQTKYIIVGDSYMVPRPAWLYPELAENGYALETIIEGQEIYHRVD